METYIVLIQTNNTIYLIKDEDLADEVLKCQNEHTSWYSKQRDEPIKLNIYRTRFLLRG